jgi:hypothetical protein
MSAYGHKADIGDALTNVCFWGKTGHQPHSRRFIRERGNYTTRYTIGRAARNSVNVTGT